MRQLRYSVASSIDGFIAGPNGEFDWIPMDPDIDFGAMFGRYDTLLLGRKTFEASAEYPSESMALPKPNRIQARLAAEVMEARASEVEYTKLKRGAR